MLLYLCQSCTEKAYVIDPLPAHLSSLRKRIILKYCDGTAVTFPTEKNCCFDTKSINCDTVIISFVSQFHDLIMVECLSPAPAEYFAFYFSSCDVMQPKLPHGKRGFFHSVDR